MLCALISNKLKQVAEEMVNTSTSSVTDLYFVFKCVLM